MIVGGLLIESAAASLTYLAFFCLALYETLLERLGRLLAEIS